MVRETVNNPGDRWATPFTTQASCSMDEKKRTPDGGAANPALHDSPWPPLWPAAMWNVSGLFVFDDLISDLIVNVKRAFGVSPPVRAVHGAPDVLWNGGRLSRAQPTSAQVDQVFDWYNQRGIGIFMTFTNHLLQEDHLADRTCNHFLELLNSRTDLNGVVLSSDLLSDHVRRRYPDLQQTASIVKVSVEGGRSDLEYYRRLADRFDRFVLHPDDNFNEELVQSLDKSKIELIVNENCVVNCATRARHYELSSADHLNPGYDLQLQEESIQFQEETCRALPMYKQLEAGVRNCNLSARELGRLYGLGFRSFKLQGRGDSSQCMLYDLTRYLLEPEVAAPLIFKACSPEK